MLPMLLQDLVLVRSGCRVVVDVPRALMISQLLQESAAGFPMAITVTILESASERTVCLVQQQCERSCPTGQAQLSS